MYPVRRALEYNLVIWYRYVLLKSIRVVIIVRVRISVMVRVSTTQNFKYNH